MRTSFLRALGVAAALLAAPAAWAENVALIIANTEYRNYPVDPDAGAVLDLAPRLRDAGFRTIVVRDLDAAALSDRMPAIARQLLDADRFVVVTAGYYAALGGQSWLLTSDADAPHGFDIGRHGLWFGSLYNIASSKPGDALIAVALPDSDPEAGWRLAPGFRRGGIPQGVTLVTGRALALAGFLTRDLLVPGRAVEVAAANAPDGVEVTGYVPASRAFLAAETRPDQPATTEESLWIRTRRTDTVAAYETYIAQYPDGRYLREARARIHELSLSPEDRARATEQALGLSREQRSRLQEYLTVLGYDTRGIDGVFGPNTRSAIRAWQRDSGTAANGYLTANQVARIEIDGAARAEALRREAEQRQRERERRDRSYWAETGADGTAEGLRAYLERYPDGLFAARAERELREIDRDIREQAEAQEREIWDAAVSAGTLDAYRRYLDRYPDGTFAGEARARIRSLSAPETAPEVIEAARQEERALNLDPFRKRLIEVQLDKLGLGPGAVDGRFDDDTRRALRRFQRANEMPVTGYVTRTTIVRLLVSAIE